MEEKSYSVALRKIALAIFSFMFICGLLPASDAWGDDTVIRYSDSAADVSPSSDESSVVTNQNPPEDESKPVTQLEDDGADRTSPEGAAQNEQAFQVLSTESELAPMAVNADIPTIDQTIINDAANYPVVLIDSTADTQVGCAGLADAWTKIGTTSTDDYQVVVIRDYTMTETDHTAILGNAGAAASLTLTSTYYPSSTPTTAASATVTASGTSKRDFNFQSAETLVHDFNFTNTGCSRFLACGNKLTMGEGITTTGTNIQVFAGGSSNLTIPSPNSAVVEVNSGTYRHVFGGNYQGTYSGAVDITVQGDTNVWVTAAACVAAGGQTANGAGSYSKVTVKGPDVQVREIRGCYVAGDSSTKDIYIDNADMGIIGPGTNSTGTSTTHLSGTVTTTSTLNTTNLIVQDNASVDIVSTLTATGSVEIGSSATLTQKGPLKVTVDFSLAQDATYTRANADANLSIGGDLNVAGSGAAINLYKTSAATAPVKMTVGGDYVGTDKLTVGFTNGTTAVSPTATGGDTLFTFITAANADGADYNSIYDSASHTIFKMIADSGNVKTAIEYQHPSYYVPVDPLNGLYSFTALGAAAGASESTGATHTEYRKYVYESGVWNVYVCDASGVTTGSPINQTTDDRPQPAMDAQVQDYAFAEGYMVRFDEVGKYRITACAGTNYDGLSDSGIGTASGSGNPINIDEKGAENSSWAVLKQSSSTSSIYKAYLVMTTTLSFNKTLVDTTDGPTLEIRDRLLNTPMKLECAATGNSMMSNGYLPEGFTLAQTRTTGAVEGAITSDTPTMLRDYATSFTRPLGEAMTITDVTDFVKANGYGKYYGSDIPKYGTDPDAAIAWRLVVLESDPTMEYNRMIALQMGPFTNGNATAGQNASSMKVDFNGYLTPAYGDFGGQVLFIGSDNLTGNTSGGNTGSNIHANFYPMGDITDSADAHPIGTNDALTPVIERPLSGSQSDNWSQGQMDINGTKLTSADVSHINTTTAPGAMGIDLSLLDVTDKDRANTAWETAGGHNLYLEQNSSGVAITSQGDTTGVGYLDVVGLASDIEEPKFAATIIHTDISMTGLEGTDIVAGKPVKIRATAENHTPYISKINGSLNTHFVITLDEKLSNIRPTNGGSTIQATFHNYDETTHTNNDVQVTGVYNATDHTLTFEFGTPYWDKDNNVWRNLFNSNDKDGEQVGGDSIEVEFLADTSDTATIDDPDVNYTNTVVAKGTDMILQEKYLRTPETVYADATDTFDTYHNLTRISKTVEGTYADMTKSFTFAVTLKDAEGNYLPKGTTFDYKGGTLSGTGTAPADGTLTVGDNGVVTFGLKNDQFITITDLTTGSIVVTETDYTGYNVTWRDSTWPTTVHPDTDYETAVIGSTGDIVVSLSKSEVGDRTRNLDFINKRTEIVPSGISSWADGMFLLAIIAIVLLGVFACLRKQSRHSSFLLLD